MPELSPQKVEPPSALALSLSCFYLFLFLLCPLAIYSIFVWIRIFSHSFNWKSFQGWFVVSTVLATLATLRAVCLWYCSTHSLAHAPFAMHPLHAANELQCRLQLLHLICGATWWLTIIWQQFVEATPRCDTIAPVNGQLGTPKTKHTYNLAPLSGLCGVWTVWVELYTISVIKCGTQ